MEFLGNLAAADKTTLILILLIMIVVVGVPGWVALARDYQRGRSKQEDKRLDNESKPLDALNGLADSFKSFIEFDREREKSHQDERAEWRKTTNSMFDHLAKSQEDYRSLADVRTQQINKQLGISGDQAESIAALQTGQDRITKTLGTQEPTLQETHDMVQDIQKKIDQLPEQNKQLLQEFLSKLEQEWTTFKADVVKTVVDAMTKQTPDVNVPITINNPPPATLPEQTKPADTTQKLGDTLPAVEPDPTQPVKGGMPNGLPPGTTP